MTYEIIRATGLSYPALCLIVMVLSFLYMGPSVLALLHSALHLDAHRQDKEVHILLMGVGLIEMPLKLGLCLTLQSIVLAQTPVGFIALVAIATPCAMIYGYLRTRREYRLLYGYPA